MKADPYGQPVQAAANPVYSAQVRTAFRPPAAQRETRRPAHDASAQHPRQHTRCGGQRRSATRFPAAREPRPSLTRRPSASRCAQVVGQAPQPYMQQQPPPPQMYAQPPQQQYMQQQPPQVHPSMQGQMQLPNTPSNQNLGGGGASGGDDGPRAAVGGVGGFLLLVVAYVAWPSDSPISVQAHGVNVTNMMFPDDTYPPDPFVFEMDMPLEITSTNYFEHEATLAVEVSYTGLSSIANGLGMGSECPCALAAGSQDVTIESRPVLSG